MSKLGKKPILIPKDTKVKFETGKLILTGPKGSKELTLNDKIFTATITEENANKVKKQVEGLNSIDGNFSSNKMWEVKKVLCPKVMSLVLQRKISLEI